MMTPELTRCSDVLLLLDTQLSYCYYIPELTTDCQMSHWYYRHLKVSYTMFKFHFYSLEVKELFYRKIITLQFKLQLQLLISFFFYITEHWNLYLVNSCIITLPREDGVVDSWYKKETKTMRNFCSVCSHSIFVSVIRVVIFPLCPFPKSHCDLKHTQKTFLPLDCFTAFFFFVPLSSRPPPLLVLHY